MTSGRITATPPTGFRTERRTADLISGFVQDDIVIVPERWRASVGTKLEHNAYSGFEVQPSGRLVWTPNNADTVVSPITRAVRVPSRVETDYTTASLVNTAPTFVRLLPNPGFVPEKLVAYETSYRVRPIAPVYVTFSGFFNHLQDSLRTEILTPFVEVGPSSPYVVIPVQFANGLHGSSHGAELTADVRPTSWWRWTTNYSYLRISMTRDEGSRDSNERRYEGFSPRHQVQLQSSLDLPHRWSADWMLRHVSRLPFPAVPAYTTSDVRVAWRMTPRLELAVVGQNLHQASHVEWPSGTGANIGNERRGYVRLIWRR